MRNPRKKTQAVSLFRIYKKGFPPPGGARFPSLPGGYARREPRGEGETFFFLPPQGGRRVRILDGEGKTTQTIKVNLDPRGT